MLFLTLLGVFLPMHGQAQTIHIPEAPGHLQASAVSAFQIGLTWNDESRNEDGFKIERSTDATNFTQIAQVPANTTNYLDTGLFPGTTYCYRVRAYNSAGNSRFSKIASATTLCTVSVAEWGYPIGAPPSILTGVVAIAAGGYHSLALTGDGTVVGWGADWYGQATPPTNLTSVAGIAAGGYHSLALKKDGTVVGWGADWYGQATPPVDLTNVVAIAAGGYHSLALKSDGTVVGWGADWSGQATPPTNLTGVVAIAAGGYHSLALKSDGTIVGWGYDGYGQATSPAGLSGGTAAIAAGSYYSLALTVAPSTPSAPTAIIVATNQLDLSWFDTSANEDEFKIERAPDDGLYNPGTWAQIATVSANITNYSDTGVMTNTTYWYRVQSSNTCGDSPYSDPSVVSVAPPGAPYLSVTVVATNQVEAHLHWQSSAGTEAGYKIERAPDNGGSPGTWTEIAVVVGTYNTFYSDTVAPTTATYWYRVRAYNVLGDSPYSSPTVVSVAPPPYAPYPYANVIATNQAEVFLYWYDYYNSSGNVTGYKIERAPDVSGSPGTWTEIATVVGYNYYSVYTDPGVMPNTRYWYRVRAYNVVGHGPYSYPTSIIVGPPLYPPYPYANVIATNQAEVFLYWYDYNNYSGSVAGYKIERAPDVSGNPGTWTQIATVAGYSYYSSYTDSGVLPNATYWYRVRAYNVVGDSPDSYPINIIVGPPIYAPYLYSYLVITNQPEVHLYWYDYNNYSGSVAGYKLERAPDVSGNPGTWTEIATVTGYNYYSSYADTVAPTSATYWYRVRAYNVIGDSPDSYPIVVSIAPPAAPYYLNAYLPTTNAEVALYWYYTTGTEAGYKIERAADDNGNPGTWAEIATTVGQYSTSYSDTTVETNTTYWYRVRAYNAVGDSPPSYAVSIGPPPAPSNLTAAIAATNQVNLSWSESYANVAGFKIERAPDDNGNPGTWAEIATTVGQYSTSYSDTTVETNTTYWYRVRAYNVLGDSPYSNEASVSLAPPSAAPSNLTATPASSSQINLSWTDNSNNETSFKIERSTDGTNFTQIAQVLANTTNYRNTGLLPDTTYYYRVRASNPVDDSAFSDVASAGTPAQCTASVVGWGYNGYGGATPPAGLSNVVAIAAGDYHSLALKSDGTVVGWGYNGDGQTTPPAGLTGVVAIAAGFYHSLALKSDGTVVGWGYNGSGQTTPPAGLSGVVAITAGAHHSLALKSDGTVVGWGYYYYASPPAGLVGVVAIAASDHHSLAVKSDGTVVGWGSDYYGEPTPPAGLSGVVAVAAGYYHSLALKSDGTVVGWGHSGYATPPAGLSNVVAIAAGYYHGLAMKSDSTVVGWGNDGYGEATPPAGLTGVAVAAGAFHSLALTTALTAPSTFTAAVISSNQVNLLWTDNASTEDGFKIERASDNSGSPGTWTQIATVGADITTYSDTGVSPSATHWYRVQAYNVCTNSPYSNQASVTTAPPPAQQITVMQWNILRGLGRQSNNSSTQARAIARIVNFNQPDILLFNEIDAQNLTADGNRAALIDWVTNNIPYLGSQPGATFYVTVSSQSDGFNRNGAISRYPILTAGTYDDGLRGLHSFRVQLGGTNQMQVYHAHLKCCSDDCPRKHYEAQFDADTISAWAATNTIPYIFAGDWNDDELSPLCSPPNTITTIREGGGLVEFKPTTLSGEYRTWSTRSGASIRFDYILAASNRLSASSGYVFSTMNWASHSLYTNTSPQNLVNDSQTASDHYSVFVKYFFPGPDFTVTPTNAFASAGYPGGPFSPPEQVYTLSNTNSISLPWGVTKTTSWLTISATNGVLAAGASTNITVSINSTANSLSSGSYADGIRFGLIATGAYVTRSASLTVLLPPPPVVDFTGSPTNGVEPLTVTFSDASTGNITGRAWDFGDTSTTNTTTNSVTHTFMAGNFSVRLIVSGPGGITTNVRPNYITAWTAFQNWLIQYFGCTDCPQAEATADPDGDGQDNMSEFQAGTDPTNGASVLRITSITRDSSNIRITWTTAGGRINMVQGAIGTFDEFGYPSSPAYANEFFDISDPIGIAGSGDAVTNFVDDGSWLGDYTNWPARYYRIKVVP